MPCTLTLASVRDETRTSLGSSGCEIELLDKDVDKALKDAIRVYNHYRPRHARAGLPICASQKKYPITRPGLSGIVSVQFIEPRAPISSVDPFDYLSYSTVNPAAQNGYGDREMTLGYIEYARTVASSEPEWQGQWEGDSYFLYVDVAKNYLCSYECTWLLTPNDDAVTGIKFADGIDEDWIMDYTLARAKTMLSRVRGKFAGIVNPDGAQDTVDYAELQQEGREDMKDLLEQIRKRRRPLAPVTG